MPCTENPMKANESTLDELHNQVAATLIEALAEEEVRPSILGHAIKFLKDNEIITTLSDDTNMHTLNDALKEKRAKRKLRIVGDE